MLDVDYVWLPGVGYVWMLGMNVGWLYHVCIGFDCDWVLVKYRCRLGICVATLGHDGVFCMIMPVLSLVLCVAFARI